MADFGLFIGWGEVRAGRTAQANTVFAEALAYWSTLRTAGEIESFETVILGYHGGDLGGFFLVRGDPERIGRLRMSPEFQRLMNRAAAIADRVGVVDAAIDDLAVRQVGDNTQAIADLV